MRAEQENLEKSVSIALGEFDVTLKLLRITEQ